MYLNKDTINKIIDYSLKIIKPYLVYIFGSAVNGNFNEDSDIDIAFLSDEEFTDYEVFIMAQELADIVKRDVDLINLKKASTVFKAQVVGTGEKIYCTDETRRMYFEMRAFKEYALLNEEREIIMENIKKRGSVYGK
ncbi:type VII toxin-antitoxin system MntA family adenylyltransferase antitoxin [Clostridium cochlearium]|uniref:type VII toxin-antitoxin system MntA family adenylyltransferase antitoxin n=1 Tax=Clostridium cochlearium TaxID=1494 RepID=UPI000B946ECF|nr:nucleotidyltransferase domain-containing protein [Clostridium cochlearium]MBV1821784.1 nucleotidyltransferase domain-containing protein [Bacteroidales bacterium MSK.15.36]MCG4572559.1 nucleotidyltransferase domain-containing protein [Clostridium cochlearium]MDU1444173.1 nucleotidyltransferase domain-containing protein [Clostridium cochlearium]SNV81290.1 putative nucleotidyltransferase [Clostridium cochlearium]STA92918.1 putative nucleotidyltransferase [Clostridium cochlearium]